jgi:hypothetical protein
LSKVTLEDSRLISLFELKALAKKLRADSSLRALILSEPDYVARERAMVLASMWAQLLYLECDGSGRLW